MNVQTVHQHQGNANERGETDAVDDGDRLGWRASFVLLEL